jgi:pseudouridine-5'-phosphate glycosidase
MTNHVILQSPPIAPTTMSSASPLASNCADDLGLDPRLFYLSEEVALAIRSGFPVVALESTIITHGLPFPTNYETAMAAERRIRERGAVPATVAIVQGVVHVGASEEVCHVTPAFTRNVSEADNFTQVIMRLAKLGKAVDKARFAS